MRRTQIALFLVAALTGSLSLSSAALADESSTATQNQSAVDGGEQPPLGPNAETPEEGSAPQASDDSSGHPQARANYELQRVVVDYQEYKIGDTLPHRYLDKSYLISEWQLRKLPAPEAGSHWAYISSNYLLLTDDAGKILKAESGDIYYRG